VAEAISVTKPFIYSHFKSKNDLLAEICSRAIRVSHEALNRVFAADISPTEKLYTIARDFMLTVLQHQAHAVIYSREEKELAPEDRDAINALRRGFDRRFSALLEEGVASGEFTVDDVPLTALAIGGIVGWAPVWYRPGGRLSQIEASERVAVLVLAMVQAKSLKKRKPKGLLPVPAELRA
jgi:AcrR family transcriptional regulator